MESRYLSKVIEASKLPLVVLLLGLHDYDGVDVEHVLLGPTYWTRWMLPFAVFVEEAGDVR